MLNIAWIASIAANIGVAAAVRWRRLPYPWFEAWLWMCACASIVLVAVGRPSSWTYFWTYVVLDPLRWLLMAAAVHELFRGKLKGYRVLSWAGSAALWGAIILAVLATAASALIGSPGDSPAIAQAFLLVRRLVLSVLFVFVCAAIVFFRYYPAPAKRNLDSHLWIMALFLGGTALSTAGAWFVGTRDATPFSIAGMIWSVACYAAWAILMTRPGEAAPRAGSEERASIADAAAGRLLSGLRQSVRTAKAAR